MAVNTPEHTIRKMDKSGDAHITWDDANVADAKQMFADLKGKGYMAFRVKDGAKDEQIRDFDPEAKEIIMVPPMRGG